MFFCIVALGLLAAANRWLGRSLLYPPALFAAVWALFILLLAVSGDTFYHVGIDTLLWYLWAACAFSIGGAVAWLLFPVFARQSGPVYANQSPRGRLAIQRLLNWFVVSMFVVLPFYIYYLFQSAAADSVPSFLASINHQISEYRYGEGENQISLFDNLSVLSILVAMVCQRENDGTWQRRLRAVLAVVLALGYNLLRGERGATVILLISLVATNWLKAKKINWKQLAVVAAVFLFAFSFIGTALHKGYMLWDASLAENFRPLVQAFQLYAVGSIVAFDDVFHHPGRIPPVWRWNRFFLQAANKLGGKYYVPVLHAEYVDVGPELSMNTYTMYFAYLPDFGWLGASLIVALLGAVITLAYLPAVRGSPQAQVVFSIFFAGMVLSGFNEQFLLGLNFLIKTLLFTFFVYKWRGLQRLAGTVDERRLGLFASERLTPVRNQTGRMA